MIDINLLYKIIEEKNIIYKEEKLDLLNGFCLCVNDYTCICMNKKIKSEVMYKSVLAEEVAHSQVGIIPSRPLATDYYNKLVRSKNEYNAIKYLVHNFIPKDAFKYIYNPYMTKEDVIDKLQITEELFGRILEYLKGDDIIWQEQLEKEATNIS